MEVASPTSAAAAAGLVSERSSGFTFSFDGFNSRMADRLRRIETLTGKTPAAEHEETSPVLVKDENLRS